MMIVHKRTVEDERSTGPDIEYKLALNRIASYRRYFSINDWMAGGVQLNGNTFSRSGVAEPVLIMKLEHARLVIQFDDKRFDKLAAEYSIKILPHSRRQVSDRQGDIHRLRESCQTGDSKCRTLNVGSGGTF